MLLASLATGCGKNTAKAVKLDPNNPVSLKIWHYYNGTQQATFEDLLEEFNATVGHEDGIYVEAYSYGSVSDLDQAITSAIKAEVGAENLPDIFSSYADTAYAVQQEGKLADLSEYFTEEEKSGIFTQNRLWLSASFIGMPFTVMLIRVPSVPRTRRVV